MRSILTVIIACSLLPWIALPAQSKEQPAKIRTASSGKKPQPPVPKKETSETLDFSATGRPGQQTAGESRGGCGNIMEPIKAILPVSNSGSTVKSHPHVWVYFPQGTTATATEVEFVVQDEERRDIWRSRSPLSSAAEYQRFSLPTTEPPLPIGQWYRWYVKVYCHDQVASAQYVQGWIKRVPLTSQLHLELQGNLAQEDHLTYSNHHLWYDATDELLSSYQSKPKSLALERDWQNLTRAKGVQLEQLPNLGGRTVSFFFNGAK
jgi:Domain of Unknown Function (DUF928)